MTPFEQQAAGKDDVVAAMAARRDIYLAKRDGWSASQHDTPVYSRDYHFECMAEAIEVLACELGLQLPTRTTNTAPVADERN